MKFQAHIKNILLFSFIFSLKSYSNTSCMKYSKNPGIKIELPLLSDDYVLAKDPLDPNQIIIASDIGHKTYSLNTSNGKLTLKQYIPMSAPVSPFIWNKGPPEGLYYIVPEKSKTFISANDFNEIAPIDENHVFILPKGQTQFYQIFNKTTLTLNTYEFSKFTKIKPTEALPAINYRTDHQLNRTSNGRIFIKNQDGAVLFNPLDPYNKSTTEEIKLPENSQIYITQLNDLCVRTIQKENISSFTCYDTPTATNIEMSDGLRLGGVSASNSSFIEITADSFFLKKNSQNSFASFCIDNNAHPPETMESSCEVKNSTSDQNILKIKDIIEKKYCSEYSNVNDFPLDPNQFNLDDSRFWLKKFSRPGGITPANYPVLEKIINNGMDKKYPQEYLSFLISLTTLEDDQNQDLIRFLGPTYLKITRETNDLKVDTSCLTRSEKKEIGIKILQNQNFMNPKLFSAIASQYLTPDLVSEEFIDQMADEIVADSSYTQLNSSEIYKVANQSIRKALKMPYEEIHLFTTLRYKGKITPYLLTTESIKKSPGTFIKRGVTFVPFPEISLSDSKNQKLQVELANGDKVIGHFQSTISDLKPKVAAPHLSPPYSEMLRDKQFNGLVVADSSLNAKLADFTIRQYIDYYLKEGFALESPVEINDSIAFLQQRLTNEHPIDYFIKEAHADGDSQNIFSISAKGLLIRGKKIVNGIEQNIEILYPNRKNSEAPGKDISNQEFGRWIKEREGQGLSPLLYFNSSCWSFTKAINEFSSANSASLIELSTNTATSTFANKNTNSMKIVINSFLHQETYAQMRDALSQSPRYQSGKKDIFIFPDEELYRTKILSELSKAVDITISTSKIVNEKEESYITPKAH